MRAWVAVMDKDWYRFLSRRPDLEAVNFWQPGGSRVFGTLSPGEPFLFKLHYPDNAIVGGGFFTHASRVPASMVWDAFGEKNGAASYEEMCRRIERYRHEPLDPRGQYTIGCIILQEPFFFAEADWLPAPPDFRPQTVTPDHRFLVSRRLKTDFDNGEPYYPLSGKRLWLPGRDGDQPGREFLEWHADAVCRG